MEPPIFLSQGDRLHVAIGFDRFQPFVAGHLFFGCAQYAAGSKKVRFPALSNEIFEMSGVNMIRPNHGGEAIESPSPPAAERRPDQNQSQAHPSLLLSNRRFVVRQTLLTPFLKIMFGG